MKIKKYEEIDNNISVELLFDDNTFSSVLVVDKNRDKEEILKDAYILSSNQVRKEFEGDSKDFEKWEIKQIATSLEVDFWELKGKVYNQFGEIMTEDVEFSVIGDKAKIVDGKVVEEEVEEETKYTIVAKANGLEKRQERVIFANTKEKQETQEEKVERLENELQATNQALSELLLMNMGGGEI